MINYYPGKRIKLTIDSAAVMANGAVSKEDADKIVKEMVWDVSNNYLMKNDLMIPQHPGQQQNGRPIYFATTRFRQLPEPRAVLPARRPTHRIVPIRNDQRTDIVPGRVNKDIMYNNVMNKFVFGNMNDEQDVYLDENNLRMTTNFRINFSRLGGRADECRSTRLRHQGARQMRRSHARQAGSVQLLHDQSCRTVLPCRRHLRVTDTLAGNDRSSTARTS